MFKEIMAGSEEEKQLGIDMKQLPTLRGTELISAIGSIVARVTGLGATSEVLGNTDAGSKVSSISNISSAADNEVTYQCKFSAEERLAYVLDEHLMVCLSEGKGWYVLRAVSATSNLISGALTVNMSGGTSSYYSTREEAIERGLVKGVWSHFVRVAKETKEAKASNKKEKGA